MNTFRVDNRCTSYLQKNYIYLPNFLSFKNVFILCWD